MEVRKRSNMPDSKSKKVSSVTEFAVVAVSNETLTLESYLTGTQYAFTLTKSEAIRLYESLYSSLQNIIKNKEAL